MWTVGRCVVYTGISLLLLICPFIFLSLQFSNIIFFRHTFLRNCEAMKVETLYTHGQWTDVSCIPKSGYCCLFVPLFLPFSFSDFFVTLFSGTMRLRRLKLGTHMESGQMYRVYWNQATATYMSLYFFIFLSLDFHFFLFLQFSVHYMSFSSDSAIAGLNSDLLAVLVLIQHILCTQVSDTKPVVLWF